MSRLDRHVGTVQMRMALSIWLKALAWALIVFAALVWATIMIERAVQLHLPRQMVWLWVGLGVTIAASLAYTVWRRPSRREAAVAIDEKLLLKEKFSTALYVRLSRDPFAQAAVCDAERTADKVNLHKQFPLRVPSAAGGTVVAAGAIFLTLWLMPTLDLFGIHAREVAKSQAAQQAEQQARDGIRRAILTIEAAPKAIAQRDDIRLALKELKEMQTKPVIEPQHAWTTAQKAVQNVEQALKDKIQQTHDFAVTQEELKEYKSLEPGADEKGPMADAQRNMAHGQFEKAVDDLTKAVDSFNKMDKQAQKEAADQARKMASALQKMANDPKVQQEVQKQLQQMGVNQQQQQQMMQLMQAAAAGDKQAQQQLQQAAKQLAQQMNQGGKGNAQQQRQLAQQVQNAIQQMQAKVNTQVNAQQLAQSAQALAQAMQQAAQGGGPGQQQAGGNANKQPGGQQAGQQQMANAAQQMQQQLQQMQAVANAAQQQVGAGQNGAGQGNQGAGNQNGQNGNGNGNQQQAGAGPGPWNPGQNQQQGAAQGGGPGVAGPGNNRPAPVAAPFVTKDESDVANKDEKGKLLASTFVKAGSIRGDAKMQLRQVVPTVEKDATDEVDEQRVPRQDQDVVKGYFDNIQKDAK